MPTRRENPGFERLVQQKAKNLPAGEMALLCARRQGKSAPVSDILGLVAELQKLIYRVGEYHLGLAYRKNGKPRTGIRDQLGLIVGVPKTQRAFSLQFKVGDFDSIPFEENSRFREQVFKQVGLLLVEETRSHLDMTDKAYATGIDRILDQVKSRLRDFENVFILGIANSEGGNIIGLK
ncbi:MAG: hypothetical protein O3B73_09045 [bacterium]|nr:hypothetical protein [bacterium]